MKRPEQDLQKSVAEILNISEMAARGTSREFRWFHCPNGGGRSKAEAGILKAMGVKLGVPDILIMPLHGKVDGLELKAPGGRTRVEQHDWLAWIEKRGGRTGVASTIDEAINILREWGYVGL